MRSNTEPYSQEAFLRVQEENTRLRREIDDLQRRYLAMEHMATFDELTRLYRRWSFEERARALINSKRHGQRRSDATNGIAMLLLDVRNFKHINDNVGQKKGDRVLCNAANAIKKRMRENDLYCRFGGDEFGVLLVSVSEKEIPGIVRAINAAAAEIDDRISFHYGYACLREGDTYDTVSQRADDDLYAKKRMDKN